MRCGRDIRRILDIVCSISQNIQTNAVPKPITTIKNNNVNAGAVSMFNIPHAMQKRICDETKDGLGKENTEARHFIPL